jgi:peptidoglycan hydrolase-like amidase
MMENDAALVLAAENGETDTVRALLDAGANVRAVDDLALWLAAKNGHTETVKVLLDAGANSLRVVFKIRQRFTKQYRIQQLSSRGSGSRLTARFLDNNPPAHRPSRTVGVQRASVSATRGSRQAFKRDFRSLTGPIPSNLDSSVFSIVFVAAYFDNFSLRALIEGAKK